MSRLYLRTSQIIELKSGPPLKKVLFSCQIDNFSYRNSKGTSQKKCFFLVKMITSLTEIAKLPNFGQMATSTIKFVLRIKICW